MKWYSAAEKPFKICGLCDNYKRLPPDVIGTVNDTVTRLANHSAGGRIRFATDSSKVAVRVKLYECWMMNHMPLSGMSGVDFFADGIYHGTARPDTPQTREYQGESAGNLGGGFKEIELFLPLYNGVIKVEIGVDDGARVKEGGKYRVEKPVLFYGSSITQGGCASRPSNAYTALVSRWLDCDHINLGFSGAARGEENIARYIASLELSAFVMDYDHNAPDAAYLKATHRRFFDIIRKAQPELPVIFMTKPDFDTYPEDRAERRAIIEGNYIDAYRSGDRNVYFIDGESLFGSDDRGVCTVDTCHPNDIGFWRMAKTVYRVLKNIV